MKYPDQAITAIEKAGVKPVARGRVNSFVGESHMYTDEVDITYHHGPAEEIYEDRRGKLWSHSRFCQCHLERKLRGE